MHKSDGLFFVVENLFCSQWEVSSTPVTFATVFICTK
ncbi:hypothetical protein C8N47_1034 [Mangrovibacterium marinum]|uniref:Uncharacterized protein n=1 Tax=Mangrovibacterium marinum TaxID=1639118 RepID=A0A2T5C4B7_9BACT|nr:hypothetical protein C8N47_1034 [Mangrovibacterium marinum]